VRCQKGEHSAAAQVEWLRAWEAVWAGPSSVELLLPSRPLRYFALNDYKSKPSNTERHGPECPAVDGPLIHGEMRRYENAIFQIVLCGFLSCVIGSGWDSSDKRRTCTYEADQRDYCGGSIR